MLPRRRVEDEHHVVRRRGVEAAEHALDLGEFVHQLALVLTAAGGVDDQHVAAGSGSLLHRREDDARALAAPGSRPDTHTQPLSARKSGGYAASGYARVATRWNTHS